MQLNPYLSFDGNCREAFQFYEKVLGGKIVAMMTWAETPMKDQSPPETHNKIVHARLIAGEDVLMGRDAPGGQYRKPQGITVTINTEEPIEAERIFQALSEGGAVMMPIAETFWARRFGMLTDRYGTPWMINCEKPM